MAEDRRYNDEDVVGAIRLAIEIADTPESFIRVTQTILDEFAYGTPAGNQGATQCLIEAIQSSSAQLVVAGS